MARGGELSIAYQPIVAQNGRLAHAEALARWTSPELGVVPPGRFIAVAEKAGLIEGDRIQAVNGVNVRVASEDAGDGYVSSARAQRLSRELQKAKVGEAVELRVWSGGQVKTVRVTPVRSGDLFKDRNRSGTRIYIGDGVVAGHVGFLWD